VTTAFTVLRPPDARAIVGSRFAVSLGGHGLASAGVDIRTLTTAVRPVSEPARLEAGLMESGFFIDHTFRALAWRCAALQAFPTRVHLERLSVAPCVSDIP
jgi:hypothetical protein